MKYHVLFLLIATVLVLPIVGSADEAAPQGTVNLNTASADQLQLLPRVGPALAAEIIAFRDSNGPFRSVDELVAVKGIGENSLNRLSPYVSVSGNTTLSEKIRSPRAPKSSDEKL